MPKICLKLGDKEYTHNSNQFIQHRMEGVLVDDASEIEWRLAEEIFGSGHQLDYFPFRRCGQQTVPYQLVLASPISPES